MKNVKNVTKDLIDNSDINNSDYDITYQDIAVFVWLAIFLTTFAFVKWCLIVIFKK